MAKRIGLYPGTFDPITKGHLHIIARASRLVDELVIAVAVNDRKKPLFTTTERMKLVAADIGSLNDISCPVRIEALDGLLIQHARKIQATCIIRGLRAVSDFEYEFQMTGINAKMAPEIETVFLAASEKWQFVSSSFIREIASFGGDISDFVTATTENALKTKLLNAKTPAEN